MTTDYPHLVRSQRSLLITCYVDVPFLIDRGSGYSTALLEPHDIENNQEKHLMVFMSPSFGFKVDWRIEPLTGSSFWGFKAKNNNNIRILFIHDTNNMRPRTLRNRIPPVNRLLQSWEDF